MEIRKLRDRLGLTVDEFATELRVKPVSVSQWEKGEAMRLYATHKRRAVTCRPMPENPLLYVPTNTSRSFDQGLEAAGIPKYAPNGKLDFHSCRVAFINLILDSGVTVKEAQALARHATPEMTMNVYGRVRDSRRRM